MSEAGLDGYVFIDGKELTVLGRPFDDTGRFYSRLPAAAEGVVPAPVWDLAQQATGISIDFITDSRDIAVDYALEKDPKGGAPDRSQVVDLYTHDGRRWSWVGILKPDPESWARRDIIRRDLKPVKRLYRAYLPHGHRVDFIRIGVPKGRLLEAAPPPAQKPICFYGTSIIHGFHASRPGMTVPAQLSRRFHWPICNVAFSGNGRMDPELVEFFAELDPAVLTIDCLPNMSPQMVEERTIPFVKAMRQSHPEIPIVLVENVVYQHSYVQDDARGGWGQKNDVLKGQYAKLLESGIENLHYLCGEGLLGNDGEATTDGVHPSDLGMWRLADAYASVLRPLLPFA